MKQSKRLSHNREIGVKKRTHNTPTSSYCIKEFTIVKWALRGFTREEIVWYLNQGVSLREALTRKYDKR